MDDQLVKQITAAAIACAKATEDAARAKRNMRDAATAAAILTDKLLIIENQSPPS